MGVQFGAAAQISLGNRFNIQPELLYHQKGFKFEYVVNKVRGNYVELPVFAKYLFGNPEAAQFFIAAGPSVGVGLSAKIIDEFDGEKFVEKIEFGGREFTRLDLGLAFGAGVQFDLGKGKLFADARYLYSLNTTQEGSEAILKNRSFGLSAGYLFILEKKK